MSEQWGGGAQQPEPPPGGYEQYGAGSGYTGGAYGPPGGYVAPSPESIAAKNQAIGALVANGVAMVLCCGIPSIGGLICAAISMNKADQDPQGAAKLNMWAWILFGATFLFDILLVVLWFSIPSLFAWLVLSQDTY